MPDLRRSRRRRFAAIATAASAGVVAGLLLYTGCQQTTVEPAAAKGARATAATVDSAPRSKSGAHASSLSYNEHIQPILAENCFSCHGPDSASRKAKLRLDHFEFATAKRDDLPAITPGNLKESGLIERITSTDPEEQMPPPDSHKRLKPEEIAQLKQWVAEGAKYEKHWSFLPPVRPAVPAVAPGWARNPVDNFVAEKLAAVGLQPSREETPARLLRRLTFDLTGLPPTPAELAAWDADHSPGAYERTVDRLLGSVASAEHFARHWLDAVRYADTHGIHIDNYRSIWPYRDWVIEAYRRNLPFDQFTIEQMAGDMLPSPTLDQKVASGFNRCLPTTSEGGAIPAEYEAIYAKDRVETMSTVWLGLTTGCASCHDHKFDPVSQRDFYSLAAFFRNNTMPAMDGNISDTPPSLFVPAVGDRDRWPAVQKEISAVEKALRARSAEAEADFESWLGTAQALVPLPLDRRVRWVVALNEADGPVRLPGVQRSGSAVPPRVAGPYGLAPKINGLDLVIDAPVPMTRHGSEGFGLLVRVEGKPSGPLLSCFREDGVGGGWEVFLEDGKVGLNFVDEKSGLVGRGVAREVLTPGRWHHVFLGYDPRSLRSRSIDVFVDGRPAASSGEIGNFPNDIIPTAPLRLGSREGARGGAAATLTSGDVWVQDVRRYDRGFLPADMKQVVSDKPGADSANAYVALMTRPEARTDEQRKSLKQHYLASLDVSSLQAGARLDGLLREDEAMRARGGVTLVMEEKKDSEPTANILIRGEYSQLGAKVGAATPEALPPLEPAAPRNRLGLARWLVSPDNPLTARVTVNRAWQHIFGTGLVESAGDFGITGSRPSHPALLDWLAVEFRESGWDYRRLVRLLVTSATYRQSAAVTPELLEKDPQNRWLARGPRYRLDAEQLRDQVLAASGLLVAKVGGSPVRPYQPEGIWEDVAMKQSTTRFYRVDAGENLYRRSLYTVWKRTAPPPAMDILNAPSREVSCVRRDRTNTPLQALVTLNEPLFVEASRQLAARALRSAPGLDGRFDLISRQLLGRSVSAEERSVLKRTLDEALVTYGRDPRSAQQLLAVGDSPVDRSLSASELAAWTIVASQVMNLDESLTK